MTAGGWIPAPEAIVQDPALGPAAAVLYGRVWRYCQGGGTCFASVSRLAAECGVGDRTVARWLKELADRGFLVMDSGREAGRTSTITTTRRWVMGEAGEAGGSANLADPQPSAKLADQVGQNGRRGRPKRQTGVGQIGRQVKDSDDQLEEKREEDPAFAGAAGAAAPEAPDWSVGWIFGQLCDAGGWLPADLTRGNREQLGKLAARVHELPLAERPTGQDLAAIYRVAVDSLSAKLGRPVDGLTVLQFREAIGRWVAGRRKAEELRLKREAAQAAAEERLAAAKAQAASPEAEAWAHVLEGLRATVPPATFSYWVKDGRPAELVDGWLTVVLPSAAAVAFVSERLGLLAAHAAGGSGLAGLRLVSEAHDCAARKVAAAGLAVAV